MYSQQELDDAVAAGVVSAESVDALRAYVARERSAIPDEEQFRLLTGFNDIFVAIAAAILLFALGWIGQSIGQSTGLYINDSGSDGQGPSFLAPLFVAIASWGLALFFTAKRRMALPSILLLLGFVGGVLASTGFLLVQAIGPDRLNDNETLGAIIGGVSAAIAAAAAYVHWRRVHVPITIAAGAASVAALFLAIVVAIVQPGDGEAAKNLILGFVLFLGIGMFLFAMWWDSSDRARLTRRSDVAFWLHLLAAPMIAHPIFTLMGVTSGTIGTGEALIVVALYVLFGLTALAVDRRALLVSALAYVLFALTELFKRFGAVELNVALTALVIGSALLLLSAYWHQARKLVVTRLPESLTERLPILDRVAVTQQAA